MRAIEVEHLSKRFRARTKAAGLKASIQSLVHPEYRDVSAVDDVSFAIERGEMMAFIGPNGAGKSTTIKMLTGILAPTSGDVRVAGLSPQRERRQLAYRVGTLFGQKSQLWFHLPPVDSFELLGTLYDVPSRERKARTDLLTERFELGEFLNTPVRKLSLGQRVRCEIAASLLHEPEILFLDEPTIGLDVVVKAAIRELLVEWNRERGTTILLTSHDAGDIERVCRRAIVIDRGRIALDQPVDTLRGRYLRRKIVSVRFGEAVALPELPDMPGIEIERDGEYAARITVDTAQQEIGAIVQRLADTRAIADITVNDPPMEDIIAAIFTNGKGVEAK